MLIDPNATNDIAAYGNIVVVVSSTVNGISPNLCYSTDGGTNWFPKQILDSSNNQYSFTSVTVNTSTGQFFAVAGTSVLTSTDGNIWSLASTLGVSANIITFFPAGPYQYVIFSTSTTILTSSDGITWTVRSALPGAGNFAAFGNSFFVIGGNGFLRRTADFITYTTPTINELTGGVSAANFNFVGGVYKGTTFIISATSTVTECVFKSTDSGSTFSLGNIGAAYYENVNNGMLVNTPDSRSQTGGVFVDTSQAISNPNRGDALSFSGTTYSLRTRQNAFITTTTGSPSTTGLSSVGGINFYDSFARTTTNVGLGTTSLSYISGTWYISSVSTTNVNSVNVPTPSFNVNVISAYIASGASITGYPFMLNNTFIVLFPNATAVAGGTEYNSSTIYYTTDLITWTQALSLPAAFNVSGPGSLGYILQFLRGEYGAGGYTFLMNYGANTRYLTTAAFTSFTLSVNRNAPGPLNIIKGSANDGTGAAGWIAFVGDDAQVSSTWRAGIYLSNNLVSGAPVTPTYSTLVGLDGTRVLIDNVTDVAHINSQFRVYCQFNNLLGVLSYGVLSVTTAGVVSQTINSALSNVKVLGRANSTLYVMSLTTGQVFSTTDGTTYTLRFTWNQPFLNNANILGSPVYLDSTSTAYIAGRLLTNVSGGLGATNWFTSADGATWTKTTLTAPNSSTQLIRQIYPDKYVIASSGNYIAIQKGASYSLNNALPVVTSGSLSNMPYKRLVTYAVPDFVTSPVFYNSTLSQYYSVSAYFGASATSTNGLVWSLNSGTFNLDTSTTENPTFADSFFYVYVASGKILYRSSVSNRYYAANLSTPTTYSLVNFPTIGTTYTGNRASNVAFDGTTYMIVNVNVGLATLYALTSSDGNTWSTSSVLLTLDDVRPGLVAGATGSFLMYEDQSISNRSAFTSNSGSTWTGSVNLLVGVCYGVSYGNSTYVAFGTNGNTGQISYSTNGTTWTLAYSTSGTGGRIYAGTYTNLGSGFFIAGGIAGTGGSAIVYSNTAGTTWSNATVGGSPITGVTVTQIIDGGASASPRFVALIFNSTQALTSDDGVTWSFVSMVSDLMPPFSLPGSNYNNFVNGRWTFGSYINGIINKPHLILTNG